MGSGASVPADQKEMHYQHQLEKKDLEIKMLKEKINDLEQQLQRERKDKDNRENRLYKDIKTEKDENRRKTEKMESMEQDAAVGGIVTGVVKTVTKPVRAYLN